MIFEKILRALVVLLYLQSKQYKLMLANNIWKLIGQLFEKIIFAPYDMLRHGTDNWWTSNLVSWILVLIGFIALFYWMDKMYGYKRNGKEDEA